MLNKKEEVQKALATVIDPELHIPITEMGLIYTIKIANNIAYIKMTLTTIGCPLFDVIHNDIKKAILKIDDIIDSEIELTFDPPWTPEMMSDAAKAEFGFL